MGKAYWHSSALRPGLCKTPVTRAQSSGARARPRRWRRPLRRWRQLRTWTAGTQSPAERPESKSLCWPRSPLWMCLTGVRPRCRLTRRWSRGVTRPLVAVSHRRGAQRRQPRGARLRAQPPWTGPGAAQPRGGGRGDADPGGEAVSSADRRVEQPRGAGLEEGRPAEGARRLLHRQREAQQRAVAAQPQRRVPLHGPRRVWRRRVLAPAMAA